MGETAETASNLVDRAGRPRGAVAWLLIVAAVPLAALAAAFVIYQLHPTENTILPGELAALPLDIPWAILLLAVVEAGLAWIASRFRARLATCLFALAAAATAIASAYPIVAVWLYAQRYNVPVSLATSLRHALDMDFGGPQPDKTVHYATAPDGTKLVLDAWLAGPAANGALRPAIVKVHGGGWLEGQRSEDIGWNLFLNKLGYAVFDIEYRMTPPQRWKDEIGDVKCALGWVAANAARYGVDPKRISVLGFSAGGHLAMLAAYGADDARFPPSCDVGGVAVKSVINIYGPADLALLYRSTGSPDYVRDCLEQYVGGPVSRYPERYRALSPLAHVGARTPPTITVLGRSDHIVPLDQAAVLERALTRAGVANETYRLPASDHGFDANRGSLATQFARSKVEAFLRKHG